MTWGNGEPHSASPPFADTEEVTGSNPVAPTTVLAGQSAASSWWTALLTYRGRTAAAACSPPNPMGPPELGWTGRVTTLGGRRVGVGPVSSMAGRPRRHPYPGHLWGLVSTWSHSCSPANRPAPWHGTSSLGRRRARAAAWALAALDPHASPQRQPTTIPSSRVRPGQATTPLAAPRRHVEPAAPNGGCPPHRRIPASSASDSADAGHGHRRRVRPDTRTAPVVWTPDVWTPDVWTPDVRLTTGRTPARRTEDADRATTGVAGVRTASTATATATAGWAPKPRLGCRICGARPPMTARGDDTCRRGDWAAAQQCST